MTPIIPTPEQQPGGGYRRIRAQSSLPGTVRERRRYTLAPNGGLHVEGGAIDWYQDNPLRWIDRCVRGRFSSQRDRCHGCHLHHCTQSNARTLAREAPQCCGCVHGQALQQCAKQVGRSPWSRTGPSAARRSISTSRLTLPPRQLPLRGTSEGDSACSLPFVVKETSTCAVVCWLHGRRCSKTRRCRPGAENRTKTIRPVGPPYIRGKISLFSDRLAHWPTIDELPNESSRGLFLQMDREQVVRTTSKTQSLSDCVKRQTSAQECFTATSDASVRLMSGRRDR